ncbi:aldehyde dehydrogenase (NADP(+)) [Arcticibacter tournemirensis]|uniref:Aldehyde dehydrogenase (NADP(+)) n=1 Tax=Arcticibacter tournemirensis TaxID=699437 RepID=A0A4Q0MFY9_9SPHI|nr:aldehyde dehydrogenase (NADP(+)) [Arcticibacter tournemirensis]RXF72417.1 aldehyde dehydrogenase (NADP(+)) [Arcticibacter tournemirensis]
MDGRNIVANNYVNFETETFKAINPTSGGELEGEFFKAGDTAVSDALAAACRAFQVCREIPKRQWAAFLRAIASEIASLGSELTERAAAESGLPLGRLSGETGRTTSQLNMFADLVEEGSWVDAVIDTALPDRAPLPRPDIRKMLVPLGPVVVFGASNFPLAFSVAGGDTASAFAAGCPVIVKAHPAHPGTSALVGQAILTAAMTTGMPEGVFSLLYDNGYSIGEQLVRHPETRAVTFTGSFKGGMALVKIAHEREVPIPVFAEMGSINPVVFLPEAIKERSSDLATKYAASITLGAGQFCTNPGLLLVVKNPALDFFISELSEAIRQVQPAVMLTPGICSNYKKLSEEALAVPGVTLLARSEMTELGVCSSIPVLAKVSAADFIANAQLKEEVFGPYSLLVIAEGQEELEKVVDSLGGQLTITVMAEPSELSIYRSFIYKLGAKAGRLILNGVPTGVEVCPAMQHGGPFPSTNDSRFTSVGTSAIYRFVRPLSWQDWPDELLPSELKNDNPSGIWRKVNNKWTKE